MKIFLLIFLTTIANYGFCCTCGPTKQVAEQFEKFDKVVIGTILDQNPVFQIDSTEYNRLIQNGIDETQARRFTSGGYYEYKMVIFTDETNPPGTNTQTLQPKKPTQKILCIRTLWNFNYNSGKHAPVLMLEIPQTYPCNSSFKHKDLLYRCSPMGSRIKLYLYRHSIG